MNMRFPLGPRIVLLLATTLIVVAIGLCWGLTLYLEHSTKTCPPLSQCSSHSPEYYVWLVLVGIANLGFLAPSMVMVQMLAFTHSRLLGHTFWITYIALLGLLMETIVPLQMNVRETWTTASDFHEKCALGFFYGIGLHIILIMAAHLATPFFARDSFFIKACAMSLIVFGAISPLVVEKMGIRGTNQLGIQQRLMILGMLIFLCSYSLEFRCKIEVAPRGSDPEAVNEVEMSRMNVALAQPCTQPISADSKGAPPHPQQVV